MSRSSSIVALLAAVAALAACGTLVGVSSTSEDAPDGGGGDDPDPIDPADAAPKILGEGGAYDGPVPDAGETDAAACAAGMAGLVVNGNAFCVDATEVTNAQYAMFLAASLPFSKQLPECLWNTNWAQNCKGLATKDANEPVTCIDWCDAYAYCAWAGKRLCGNVTTHGGYLASGDYADPNKSEWTTACTKGGKRTYPYGDDPKMGYCPSDGAPITAVAVNPQCIGGYPELHEMAGNVGEWEQACDGPTPGDAGRNDNCRVRGGEHGDPYDQENCGQDYVEPRSARDPSTGFRCCATLP
jgi:formylglycine-generating enzyme required for sulfatase activity